MKLNIKIFPLLSLLFLFGIFLFVFDIENASALTCYDYYDKGYYNSSSDCQSYCWGYCKSLGYDTWSCSGSKCYCVYKETCSSDGYTSNYRCSGSWRQRQYRSASCSGGSCQYSYTWNNWENCGTGSWTTSYTCSGNYVQRKYRNKGCSGSSCYDYYSWENWEYCGTDYCSSWGSNYCKNKDVYHSRTCHDRGCSGGSCYDNSSTEEQKVEECNDGSGWYNEYRCDGNQPQRRYWVRGCSGGSCYTTTNNWADWGDPCPGDYCDYPPGNPYCYDNNVYQNYSCHDSGCSAGSCYDNPYTDKKLIENCNAGSYWTNEYQCSADGRYRQRKYYINDCYNNDCRTRYYWDEDYQDCGTNSWTNEYQCSGSMQQRKAHYKGCSGADCYDYYGWQDYDNCSDCSCSCGGYNVTESSANGNCSDGKDNDCDGKTDSADSGCATCSDNCPSDCSGYDTYRCDTDSTECTYNPYYKSGSYCYYNCSRKSQYGNEWCYCYEKDYCPGTYDECTGSGCKNCAPPTGAINASKTSVILGEEFTITITGYDDNDVYYITYNEGSNSWNDGNQQKCTGAQTECTRSWDITKNTAGTYTYYGWVQDSDSSGGHGCSSDHKAGIGSVTVKVNPKTNTKIDCYFGATTCIFDKSTIFLGESVWVCGILRTTGGTAIPGQTISFYLRNDGGYDKVFDVGTTDSSGYACKSWKPPDDAKYTGTKKYVLFFAGDDTYNQSQTAEYSLTVKCNVACQSAGAVGGYVAPLHCTTCDGVCGWICYRAAAIPMGYATVCLLGQDCYFPLSSFTVNNRGESCSGSATICKAGKCPSIYSQAYNGDSCIVRRSNCTGFWTGEFGLISFGVWDAYESKCIECDYTAHKEIAVCGDTTQNYQECDCGFSLDCDYYKQKEDFPCNGTGDGQCESACGASLDCDERNPGDSCGAGGACNNSCQCIVSKPDLIITATWFGESDKKVYYTIKNQGASSAGPSKSSLYVGGAYQTYDDVGSLSAGYSSNELFSGWTCTPGQTYSIKVCADKDNEVAEENEGNNCKTESLTCPGKPDLIITDVWPEGSTIKYTIKNQGEVGADYSYTNLYVDGAYQEYDYVDALSAGSSKTSSFSYNWLENCTSPSDIIKVCADDYKYIDESNEGNNCREETWDCGCVVDGKTYEDGECNPSNKCQYCNISEDPEHWSDVPSGEICANSALVLVSSSYYCYYDENCDDGDCEATQWWTSCNGTGDCRPASDHADSYREDVTVSNGKVLRSNCSQTSPSPSYYCGIHNVCSDGNCSGHKYYRSCNGSGSCRTDDTYAYDKVIYASAGYSLSSSCEENGLSLCDSTWRDSSGPGDNHYGKGGDYSCQGMCDGSGKCEYAVNCNLVDNTPPTTGIKIIRTSTGEDVTAAGTWLRAGSYTIKFEDKDEPGGSGLKRCEYSIYACNPGGTNCTTAVAPFTTRNCNWSFQITAGTSPYHLEGVGRYRIYSGATDNADNSGTDYKYLNFDFTPPETRVE